VTIQVNIKDLQNAPVDVAEESYTAESLLQ